VKSKNINIIEMNTSEIARIGLKGIVHHKKKILPVITLNPVRLSFIFRTQIKIF